MVDHMKIALIDDNQFERHCFYELLRNDNLWEVEVYGGITEAADSKADAFLLDLSLGLDGTYGLATIDKFKKVIGRKPFVILSHDSSMADECMAAGAFLVFSKENFSRDQLIKAMLDAAVDGFGALKKLSDELHEVWQNAMRIH